MPIVCVLVPAYKIAVARLGDPALADRPVIVADKRERGHAIAVCPAAYDLGAREGMTLVQAGAAAREAAIVVDDPARGRALWEGVLDALDAASPLVEDAGDGIAYLEMRGIAGSEHAWLGSVRDALASDEAWNALPFSVGFAASKFVANVAALAGNGTIVRPGDERAFVAPLPLRILGLDRTTLERLELLGVRNLRTLAALPHGPFVRRFGPEAAQWHARAGGIDELPVIPRARRMTIERSLFGEGTAEREDQLLFALRTLVTRVADDIAYAGKRCSALALELECEDGERVAIAATFADCACGPNVWKKAVRNSHSLRAAIPIPISSRSRSRVWRRRWARKRCGVRASPRAIATKRARRTRRSGRRLLPRVRFRSRRLQRRAKSGRSHTGC
jgi:nucleotidyltransferase/DNA polymerase involved in DNA repair